MSERRVPEHAAFLRRQQVAYELGVSRHTLRRMIERDPEFPRFFALTPGIEVIERSEFERWLLRKKIAARQQHQAAPT
ncbi:helix-turn-helix domain-containing protein [Ramlibacter sp. AW1]|uniref:Helix-turn-helix domain-containing protein n=1 Tax=Ramlibacter aurantiacus TaxID=2801330 RepID=A0A937D1H0_9BURK|nr:helix-turn-helix domain-containing protein [Ramlibacter aurantiacus]MBL0420514.1 helix-turn-helix domain-containing protein [Ramlibacter aurantiacus]